MRWIMIGVCALAWSVRAEFRIWEDAAGNVLEAEFVTLAGGQVLLRDQDGREYTYRPKDLCETDRHYIDAVVPPELELGVSKVTDNVGAQGAMQIVSCSVTIKQADLRPYKGELTAVLTVLSEDLVSGKITGLPPKKKAFTLPDVRGEPVRFSSSQQRFIQKSNGTGTEYAGYVLVVWDRFGNAIAKKSNRSVFEEKAEQWAPLK